jgi:hypothetical protein
MTRGEAQAARAIAGYADLDNRIRAMRVGAFAGVLAVALLIILAMTAISAGGRFAAGATVWLPAGLAALAFALIGRVRLATLKRRRRDRDELDRLIMLKARARQMRVVAPLAAMAIGEMAVADALEQRAAA